MPSERMSEAEVTLRLAFFLIENRLTSSAVKVSIDGAQVRTIDTVHFPIVEFLQAHGWSVVNQRGSFQGRYNNPQLSGEIVIDSNSGTGDVVARLATGKQLRIECKKGPLARSRSNPEYVLLHEALGQILTIAEANVDDFLAVAVPSSPKFEELAERWRSAPLVKALGLAILTVNRDGVVSGIPNP